MAKIKYVISCIFLVVSLVSIGAVSRRDVRLTGQVAGIALDWNGEEIVASFELYAPSVDSPIGRERSIETATGNDLEECLLNVGKRCGKELYADDASVLIINGSASSVLMEKVIKYYSSFENDHMDLQIFFTRDQTAAEIFGAGDSAVISDQLAASAKLRKLRYTVRDLMNDDKNKTWIIGEGGYEILS